MERKGDVVEGDKVTGSQPGSEPGSAGSTPAPPAPLIGAADMDKIIERWTERQDARGEAGRDLEPREPASAPAPAPTTPGVLVQKLETFPWKGLLWQVVGFVNAIPDGEEEAQSCVVIRALAPCVSGWGRAERRRARIRGEKVRG